MSKSLAEYLAEVRRAIPVGDNRHDRKAEPTAPINDEVDLRQYRLVSSREKAILIALLAQAGSQADAFLPQLENMMVQRNCTCGCPSLAFAAPPRETRVDIFRQNIVSEMTGEASDGTIGLILWQAGGKLTGLEAYDLAGRDRPFDLPAVETLTPY